MIGLLVVLYKIYWTSNDLVVWYIANKFSIILFELIEYRNRSRTNNFKFDVCWFKIYQEKGIWYFTPKWKHLGETVFRFIFVFLYIHIYRFCRKFAFLIWKSCYASALGTRQTYILFVTSNKILPSWTKKKFVSFFGMPFERKRFRLIQGPSKCVIKPVLSRKSKLIREFANRILEGCFSERFRNNGFRKGSLNLFFK